MSDLSLVPTGKLISCISGPAKTPPPPPELLPGLDLPATLEVVGRPPAPIQTAAEPASRPKGISIAFQAQGGPIVTLRYRAAMLSEDHSRLILVSDSEAEAYFRLSKDGGSGDMAVTLPGGTSCLVDLRTAFEFDYSVSKFMVLQVKELAPPPIDDEEVEPISIIHPPEQESADDETEYHNPRGALA